MRVEHERNLENMLFKCYVALQPLFCEFHGSRLGPCLTLKKIKTDGCKLLELSFKKHSQGNITQGSRKV